MCILKCSWHKYEGIHSDWRWQVLDSLHSRQTSGQHPAVQLKSEWKHESSCQTDVGTCARVFFFSFFKGEKLQKCCSKPHPTSVRRRTWRLLSAVVEDVRREMQPVATSGALERSLAPDGTHRAKTKHVSMVRTRSPPL